MSNLRRKINEFLKFKKQNRIVSVLIAVLSLFVLTGVTIGLIMPAVSQEGSTGTDAGGASWPYATYPDAAYHFEPNVTSVNISDPQVGTDSSTNTANVSASFVMNFEVIEGSYDTSAKYDYYYYDLNEVEGAVINIPEGGLPSSSDGSPVLGDVIMGDKIVGTYRIEDNGLIVICFDVEELTSLSTSNKTASIVFDATVNAKEGNDSDDIVLDFNGDVEGGTVTVSGFKYGNVDVDKSASSAKNDAGEDIITWTITVNNPNFTDLEGMIVTDDMLANAIEGSISCDAGYTFENGEIILGSTTANPVTITYSTKAEPDDADLAAIKGYYVNNTAKLYEPDKTDEEGNPLEREQVDDAFANVSFSPTVSIHKTSDVVYGVTGEDNYQSDEITWTVTITNTEGSDLGGFYVKDAKFVGLDSIQIEGADNYTFDSSTGTITFSEGTTSQQITITYKTTASGYNDYNNTAQLFTPSNEWDNISDSVSVEQNPVNMAKNGTVNMGKESIDWIVEISDNNLNDELTLESMVVDDDMLVSYLNSLLAEGKTEAELSDYLAVTDGSNKVSYELISENGEITGIKITSASATYVKIAYSTPWLMDGHYEVIDEEAESYKVTNSVVIDKEGEITQKTDREITFSTKADTEKYLSSAVLSQDGKSLILSWQVSVKGAAGSFTGFRLEDTIEALTEGTTHVYNEGSINGFTYAYVDVDGVTQYNWYSPVAPYEISVADDKTSFTLTLNPDVVASDLVNANNGAGATIDDVSEINFKYTTTVYFNDLTADDLIEFANTVASYDKDDNLLDSDTVISGYTIKKEITKTAGNVTVSDDKESLVIPWTITLNGENGTFVDGFEVSDYDMNIFVNDAVTPLLHQFDKVSSIVVTTNSGTITLNAETDYTVVENDDGSVTIKLNYNQIQKDDGTVVVEPYDVATLYTWTSVAINYETVIPLDMNYLNVGDVITYSNTASSFDKEDTADGTYTVVDLENSIAKDSLYANSELTINDLETMKITIDGVETECYLFKWKIRVNENGLYSGKTGITVTDTLPEGFKLYEAATTADGFYYSQDEWNKTEIPHKDNWDSSYVNIFYSVSNEGNNQIVSFDFKDVTWGNQFYDIYYVTYIPKAELETLTNEGVYRVVNTASDGLNTDSETLYVESSNVKPDGEDILTKDMVDAVAGYIKYEVDFNPSGLDLLTNSDYITLNDYLTFGDSYTNSSGTEVFASPADLLNTYLDKITFYEVNEDGTLTELKSGVSYTFTNNPVDVTYYEHQVVQSASEWGNPGYYILDVDPGNPVVIKIPKSDVFSQGFWGSYQYEDEWGNMWPNNSVTISYTTTDEYYIVTVTPPANITSMKENSGVIHLWANTNTTSNYPEWPEVTTATSSYSEELGDVGITMNVPDGKHIKIVYQYKATSPDVVTTTVSNSISTKSKYGSHYDENTKEYTASNSTAATVYENIQLEKVDASNHALNLKAGFNIYRYNGSAWEYITGYTTNSSGNYDKFTFGSTGDKAVIYTSESGGITLPLDLGYVYYIEEAVYPSGYDNTYNENVYIAYATTDTPVTSTPYFAIDGTTVLDFGDIKPYTKDTKLVIRNGKDIEVSVNKIWADGGSHEGTEVTFKLYSSTTHLSEGDLLPANATEVGEVTIGYGDSWTYKWSNLPSIDDNGNQLFYYVQEVSSEDGYTPVYVNNGIGDSGVIEVTNSKGLTVEKDWYYSDGELIDGTVENLPTSIKFKLYYSTSLKTTKPDDAVFVKEYEIFAANNWTIDVLSMPANIVDENGLSSKLYYYVDEVVVDGYTVNYKNNGSLYNGKITIENVMEPETGATLPSAGGNGTAQYIGLGTLIMAIAGIALIIIRRKPVAVKNKK